MEESRQPSKGENVLSTLRKIILAVIPVALVAGAFAAPAVAGNPPNPNFRDIPFVHEQGANQEWYHELWAGGNAVCEKKFVDGNFTNVNRFDVTFGKRTEPDPMRRIWQPALPMYGTPRSTVYKMNCNYTQPSTPPAFVNMSAQIYYCGNNVYWFEVNNTDSTRPGLATTRWIKPNGKLKKVEKVNVPPLMIWRDKVMAGNSDQDMWVNGNANSWTKGGMKVRRPIGATKKTPNKCSGFKEGLSWN